MPHPYRNEHGHIVVTDAAGGTGGGATSSVTRPATDEEVLNFHNSEVAHAEANVLDAQQKLEAAKLAHPVLGKEPPKVPEKP